MGRAKQFVRPKTVREHPHTPELEGTSPMHGDPVDHPEYGPGVIGRVEWRGPEGEWVPPLERVSAWGQWLVHVTTFPTGGYLCELDSLSRR